MRCTVPVPSPSDLATFKIPTPFASCFLTFRSVALSIFAAELHALGESPRGPRIIEHSLKKKSPGARGLRWIPEALQVSGLTHLTKFGF
jgi:hypothetical protein